MTLLTEDAPLSHGQATNMRRVGARATRFVEAICCITGSSSFVDDIRADRSPKGLHQAVIRRDTPGIFDWMVESVSFQGISNQVAANYLLQHGNVNWLEIEQALARGRSCPRLSSYWTYDSCRYDKTSVCCSEPEHLEACSVPRHPLRNGRLNQTAYSLYLFMRDIAQSDFPAWIDRAISSVKTEGSGSSQGLQDALVAPMRHIFGVSDKVLTMTLSELLMAAPKAKPVWFDVGSQMIVVDTLVHNFLHRSGILDDFGAAHAYGRACYQSGRCADILRHASSQIDARRFNPTFPRDFPRFIQHALWHYCALDGENICNGNKIDDRQSCRQIYCILYNECSKIALNL
jgi:hypothetical protein